MDRALKNSRLIAGGDIWQVSLKPLVRHKDYRGSFSEVFKDQWGTVIKPVQWSVA